MHRPTALLLLLVAIFWALFCAAPSRADEQQSEIQLLADLGLDQLMEVEVVTASRRSEPLSQVAGAVTVLDEEDIFRSGATSITQLLNLVPGVRVSQLDTDKTTVGMRGFNGLFNNKQLVLVDGRPIISPTVAGVYWGDNTIPLSMIKRIEIMRGPWTSLWGADSFNGVINIITKSAAETQGLETITTIGNLGATQTIRQGGTLGESGNYRVFTSGSYNNGKKLNAVGERDPSSDWLNGQLGFRLDWTTKSTDQISLQGQFNNSRIEDHGAGMPHIMEPRTVESSLGYGQFTWDRAMGLDANVRFRTSYTREHKTIGDLEGVANVWDMDLQYAAVQFDIHRLTMGAGMRYFWDEFENGMQVSISPTGAHVLDTKAFIQDRITLSPESWYLTLGTKIDSFDGSNIQIQPTVRLLHTRDNEEYWLAVSRAVRVESRWQRDGRYSIRKGDDEYTVDATNDLSTEKMISYEAGYRRMFTQKAQLSVSLFINDYFDLTMLEFDKASRTASVSNSLAGTAYGIETNLEWQATDWLSLRPMVNAVYHELAEIKESPIGDSMPTHGLETKSQLQILTTPAKGVTFDLTGAYLHDKASGMVFEELTLDAHTSWQAADGLLLELLGHDLLGQEIPGAPLEIQPGVDLRVTWSF